MLSLFKHPKVYWHKLNGYSVIRWYNVMGLHGILVVCHWNGFMQCLAVLLERGDIVSVNQRKSPTLERVVYTHYSSLLSLVSCQRKKYLNYSVVIKYWIHAQCFQFLTCSFSMTSIYSFLRVYLSSCILCFRELCMDYEIPCPNSIVQISSQEPLSVGILCSLWVVEGRLSS